MTLEVLDPGVNEVLDARAVTPVFQPLVSLTTGGTIGFEALARGPVGGALHTPGALFAAAERAGRSGELDWVCRAAALRTALASGLPEGLCWFVNAEPSTRRGSCPPDAAGVLDEATGRLRVVVELTERSVGDDPARLLSAAADARRRGWGVALDDVGADPRSLSLLPFVQPDVVKLDLSLVQHATAADTAEIAGAVRAYAEATGAVILAEGIETQEHRDVALSLGATHGQGWLFDRPLPLPRTLGRQGDRLGLVQAPISEPSASPWDIVRTQRPVSVTAKRLLVPMSRQLEQNATGVGQAFVLLSAFQHRRNFLAPTRDRYEALAERNVLTVAMAAGLPAQRGPGLRTVDLPTGHPLCDEWNVVVVGPHFAGALVSHDCGDSGPDPDRRFEYVITYDRPLVLRVARALLRSIAA